MNAVRDYDMVAALAEELKLPINVVAEAWTRAYRTSLETAEQRRKDLDSKGRWDGHIERRQR
jgi:hypothetical protein